MKKLKTKYLIIAIIILQVLGILSVLPDIIPTWGTAQKIFVCSIYAIIFPITVILITRWSILTIPFVGGYLIFVFFFNFISLRQGLFGAPFIKEIDYPDYNITIYICDSGFLDRSTTLKVRDSWLPVMKTIKKIRFQSPSDLDIERVDDIIEFKGRYNNDTQFNLKTGKLLNKKIRR